MLQVAHDALRGSLVAARLKGPCEEVVMVIGEAHLPGGWGRGGAGAGARQPGMHAWGRTSQALPQTMH